MNKLPLVLVCLISIPLNLRPHHHSKPKMWFAGISAEYGLNAMKNSVENSLRMTGVVIGIPIAFKR